MNSKEELKTCNGFSFWLKMVVCLLALGVPLLIFLPGNPNAREFIDAYSWGAIAMSLAFFVAGLF